MVNLCYYEGHVSAAAPASLLDPFAPAPAAHHGGGAGGSHFDAFGTAAPAPQVQFNAFGGSAPDPFAPTPVSSFVQPSVAAPSFDPFGAPAPVMGGQGMAQHYPQAQMGMHGMHSTAPRVAVGAVSSHAQPMTGAIGGGSAPNASQGGDFGDFESAKPTPATKAPSSTSDWEKLVNLSDIKVKTEEQKPKASGSSSSVHDHSMSFQGLDGFSKQQSTMGYVSFSYLCKISNDMI